MTDIGFKNQIVLHSRNPVDLLYFDPPAFAKASARQVGKVEDSRHVKTDSLSMAWISPPGWDLRAASSIFTTLGLIGLKRKDKECFGLAESLGGRQPPTHDLVHHLLNEISIPRVDHGKLHVHLIALCIFLRL